MPAFTTLTLGPMGAHTICLSLRSTKRKSRLLGGTGLDIPRLQVSSGCCFWSGPCDVFPIGLSACEAAVQDPHEPVGEGAERLVVGLASLA